MKRNRGYWWLLAAVLVALLVAYLWPRPTASTSVEMEVYGGFAYVPSGNTLEIAYMKATDFDGCKVTPIGTELQVKDGTDIVDAQPNPIPGNKKFNLAGAVVTFPDMTDGGAPIVVRPVDRPNIPPVQPANTDNSADWEDLKWVASTGDDFRKTNPLNPAWRDLVDGRVVLTGGKLVGDHPDDPVVQVGVFDFKRGYAAAANTPAVYRQALTDRTKYTVTVPKDQIVLKISGSKAGWTRIVVKPSSPGGTVKLKLSGLHSHETPGELGVGDPMLDFCQFYQILKPVPSRDQQLIPYFMGKAALASQAPAGQLPSRDQPSPGLVCGGDIKP
jgi:hypothetical protein